MQDAPAQPDMAPLLSHLSSQTGIATDELDSMLQAAKRGEDLREYFGLSQEVLASFENVAVSYYSNKLYEQAEPIFTLLLLLTHNQSSSAWRGLAACRQAALDYEGAIGAYARAIALAPSDSLSATYLSECLLLTGQRDTAIGLLDAMLEDADRRKESGAHIKRARAMRKGAEQSAMSSPLPHEPRAASRPHDAPAAKQRETSEHVVAPPEPNAPELQAFMAVPGVREQLEQLSERFLQGGITLREIADFSQEQMDAGYAVCCTLLEQQNYPRCLEICGWMLHIDSHEARFYQLAGLAALNLDLPCLAEYLFNMDSIWRNGGPDPATLIYKGEAHIRQNELQQGLQVLAEGIALAADRREYREVVQRGQLLQQVHAKQSDHLAAQ